MINLGASLRIVLLVLIICVAIVKPVETEATIVGVPLKKCVLKNIAKFKVKHLSWSLYFDKGTGLRL